MTLEAYPGLTSVLSSTAPQLSSATKHPENGHNAQENRVVSTCISFGRVVDEDAVIAIRE